MSVSCTFARALVAGLSVLALSAPQAFAQDLDAMAKWTALTVVHYRVVGEFSGEAPIFSGRQAAHKARANDRIEIEFDWNQEEMKLAGKATFKNFPTTFKPNALRQGCPPLKVDGALELATVLSVKDSAPGTVEIELKRDHPAGAVPWTDDEKKPCGSNWDPVAAKSETASTMMPVSPAMMLAMPGSDMVTPDGKSLVVKSEGWTWTFTPTPVK